MPRAALTLLTAVLLSAAFPVAAQTPHMDPSRVPGGCPACHVGHGIPESPMLGQPVEATCLQCHGTLSDRNAMVTRNMLAGDATPPLLSSALSQPYVHPMETGATSASLATTSTCTSCHAPHRGSLDAGEVPPGAPKRSPRNPSRFEYELCESCHGRAGVTTQDVTDISRLLYPGNPSYHPVEAPAAETSPSVIDSLKGGQINCTDCHGNADPTGAAGPHGSPVQYILRRSYNTTDGPESEEAYALCYGCHDRDKILSSAAFPEHGEHIQEIGASCATCHNPHGSVINRALIRFGEETIVSGVAPSPSTGRLAFESTGPGSGACYLICHGKDHGPATYGSASLERLHRRSPPSPARIPSGRVRPSGGSAGVPGVQPGQHDPQDHPQPYRRPPVHDAAPVDQQTPQE